MPEERRDILLPFLFPAILTVVLVMMKLFEVTQDMPLFKLGIHPRDVGGMLGIITSPLIHGDWQHLLSNASPILVLGWMVGYFYPHAAMGVLLHSWWATGVLVWLLAGGPAWHIGASGVVYAWAFFLLASGLLRKERRRSVVVAVIVLLYGGLLWGLMPGQIGISWESHMAGAAVGLVLALLYRQYDIPPPEVDPFEDEVDDEVDYKYRG
ncbi:rhomboid family intramembrane serine protease [soil metagenome]